jgi:SNF2 family DNA or RNA helicase
VLEDADIVLTTYHTIVSDFADKSSPLHAIEWYRVVLDEGLSNVMGKYEYR